MKTTAKMEEDFKNSKKSHKLRQPKNRGQSQNQRHLKNKEDLKTEDNIKKAVSL